jgi:acetyltransferase-like isoleucine patch superfamily enzyme
MSGKQIFHTRTEMNHITSLEIVMATKHTNIPGKFFGPPPPPPPQNCSLLIYGMGQTGQHTANTLIDRGHVVHGFLDANARPGQKIRDLPVMTLEHWLAGHDPKGHAVMIAIANAKFLPKLPALKVSLAQHGFQWVCSLLDVLPAFPELAAAFPRFYTMRADFMRRYPRHSIGVGSTTKQDLLIHDYGNPETRLVIGSYTTISTNVTIMLVDGMHHADWITAYPWSTFLGAEDIQSHSVTKGDVIIGSDVWIGFHALILSGLTIGHGAIVGAGSVVTRNVAPYSIVAGNPARHIRYRFSEPVRKALLETSWWDWPLEELQNIRHLLFNDCMEDFLRYADERLKCTNSSPFPAS